MRSSALQAWKWQLTGIGYSTVTQASGAHCPRNGLWTRSYAATCTTPQSAMQGLHPVIHVPNYMDHYSFTDPWGMDGWVNHKVVTHPASSLAQDRESSPVETSILTTMLRRQQLSNIMSICSKVIKNFGLPETPL